MSSTPVGKPAMVQINGPRRGACPACNAGGILVRHGINCPADFINQGPTSYVAAICMHCFVSVYFDPANASFRCGCTQVAEYVVHAGEPTPWQWQYQQPVVAGFYTGIGGGNPFKQPDPEPADPGTHCKKCGKVLETVGLNRTYPPKKDDMGRVICPHCTHVHGSFGKGDF